MKNLIIFFFLSSFSTIVLGGTSFICESNSHKIYNSLSDPRGSTISKIGYVLKMKFDLDLNNNIRFVETSVDNEGKWARHKDPTFYSLKNGKIGFSTSTIFIEPGSVAFLFIPSNARTLMSFQLLLTSSFFAGHAGFNAIEKIEVSYFKCNFIR